MTVIYSNTLKEHVEHLRKVFKILRQNKLYVKKEKCSFAKEGVSFLGHHIKDGKLMIDDNKVKTTQEDPSTKVPQLRFFLSLVNYYQWFIKGTSQGQLHSLIFSRRGMGVGWKVTTSL